MTLHIRHPWPTVIGSGKLVFVWTERDLESIWRCAAQLDLNLAKVT